MKIVPYRVLFEVDEDSAIGKYRYGKPTSDMQKVDLTPDGKAYVVATHDRGDHDEPGPYYQVAFRIEDPSPYSLDELELSLDSAVYRDNHRTIKNDLVCSSSTRNTKDNLWYQQSRYEYNKKAGRWEIVNDKNKNALIVDCITTSGVFRPVVLRNGKLLSNVELPWVYVLPSSVSLQNYLDMLSDLINLHDSIIQNNASTVGIGTVTAIEGDTIRIRKEIDLTKELESAIRSVISAPSELQSKKYVKMPIRKIHHFDGRVIRDYAQHGASGKTMGIEYYENHDTYENRIIKHVLMRIKTLYLFRQKKKTLSMDAIEQAVQEEFKKRTRLIEATKNSKSTAKSFSFSYNPPLKNGVPLSVIANKDYVCMRGHAPFSVVGTPYIKLLLQAQSRAELLFYLDSLVQTFKGGYPCVYSISCTLIEARKLPITRGGNTVYELIIRDITSINGKSFDKNKPDISGSQYETQLHTLCAQSQYIKIGDSSLSDTNREQKYGISDEETDCMQAEIRAELIRQSKNAFAFNDLLEATANLTNLLNDPWFSNISDIRDITNIRPSAKFQMHKDYRKIYRLITEMMEDHAILATNFDINAFGVSKTELVYEYWVFYRLLYQLQSIGFRIEDLETLTNHYRLFVEGRMESKKNSGYTVLAKRKLSDCELCIEIGYEKVFRGTDADGKPLQRTPDYYICVKQNGVNHWYFIDAKYKCFSNGKPGKVNYLQEIYDVSLSKYIADMQQIFSTSEMMLGDVHDIHGSYIIMANVDDSTEELSDTNRLFGDSVSILESKSINQWDERVNKDLIDNSSKGLPCHRYGAIHLTPDHIDELQSLLELIFEYLETGKKDEHPYLHYCWKCGNPSFVNREPQATNSSTNEVKYYKYYFTCPKCSAFRSDNHCKSCGKAIIKHTKGNYHQHDTSVTSPQWAFICPDCGSRVNGVVVINENEINEISSSPITICW